ncbi:MAG: nicotinate-nucleotide adenylyltransferase [Candidatus Aminicenantes bacterium]|nr:nicotinate-nucleotide adenylyltransferase [Candidatus Aminicenantes bacterium]
MKNRVGLLGGTFNPVHSGHVELGLEIRRAFRLDRVLYILSARPPHKLQVRVVPAPLRWKMLTIALKPYPELVPCDIEMKRAGSSWTIRTIEELRKRFPEDRFFFISGSEGFLNIKTWKDYRELLKFLSFIVVLRAEKDKEKVAALLKEENLSPCFDIEEALEMPEAPKIYIYSYRSDKLFISSTLIRERRRTSTAVTGLVDQEVEKIMLENKLYEG